MSAEQRKGLGRGLSALLGDDSGSEELGVNQLVPIEFLTPGKYQPRKSFSDGYMSSLEESIRENGILQPILVRRAPLIEGSFEIIAGERRWRAAQKAQLHEVPVIVKELSDEKALEIALIENLQREDLSPLEEARAYERLMNEFYQTQEDLAKSVGKSRSSIANTLRLLTLPDTVQKYVDTGELSSGHARTLVGITNAEKFAKEIVLKQLSVRQAEELVQSAKNSRSTSSRKTKSKTQDTIALEKEISHALGLKITINSSSISDASGTISIKYKSLDQLDIVLKKLNPVD